MQMHSPCQLQDNRNILFYIKQLKQTWEYLAARPAVPTATDSVSQ
jgi:hypothetical protein